MKRKKKIGVLTGGGDCPGLNAVIRAVAKTAINEHNMDVVGFLDGYEGLVEERGMYQNPMYQIANDFMNWYKIATKI